MRILVSVLLLALLALLPACNQNSRRTDRDQGQLPERGVGTDSSGNVRGGVGSETDGFEKRTHGTGTTKAGAIACRMRAYTNYIRAKLVADPEQGDVDTFEARLRDGDKVFEVAAGTPVTFLRPNQRDVTMPSGESFAFWRVQLDSGPHAGSKVNIYEKYLSGLPNQ